MVGLGDKWNERTGQFVLLFRSFFHPTKPALLRIRGDLIDGPRKGRAKGLVHYAAAGFADGRQSMELPVLPLIELCRQNPILVAQVRDGAPCPRGGV